ncbi:MAG: hypothetical protein AB8B91_03430 [Rubripirellula sp.]
MKRVPQSIGDNRAMQTAHFFDEVEDMIVNRLHREADSPEGRAELVRSTGIVDQQLIDEFAQLGVTADGVIAIRLFPLVMVAWAEDSSDLKERTAVMGEALRLGIIEDSTAWILLDTWLKERPRGINLDAWKRYTKVMFRSMSAVARKRLIEFTEKEMTAIAKSSGGLLGIGTVSRREREMIHKLVLMMNKLSDAISE